MDLSARTAALIGLIGTARIEEAKPGSARVNHLNRPVQVLERDNQPRTLGTHVADVEQDISRQVVLNVQVPLLDVGIAQVLIVAHREVQRSGGHRRRKWIVKENIRRTGRIADDAGAGGRLRSFRHGKDRVGNLRREVNAVAAANHGIVQPAWPVGEAKARPPVISIGCDQCAAVAGSLGRQPDCPRRIRSARC